jgi:WD40 repeat protein
VKAEPPNPSLSRTHYVRTDMVTEYPFWVNESWTVFNSNSNRFFITDPNGNQVVAMDAAKEVKLASIPVPGAYGIDQTPDGTLLYVGTQFGDVYVIDPAAMTVKHRYLASQIGPYGYSAYIVRVLANGKLVLLGGQGGYANVDGYSGFAVWSPADNSIQIYGGINVGPLITSLPNCVGTIGAFTLTGDRSLIVEGSIDSDGTLCTVDPATGAENIITSRAFLTLIAPTPDGKSLLVTDYTSGNIIRVYNAKTLIQTSTFSTVGDTSSAASMVVSPDSKTLYMYGGNLLYAYDIASGKLLGWMPNLTVIPMGSGLTTGAEPGPALQAMDGTGLIAGPMEEGIGFLDTTVIRTGTVGSQNGNAYLTPATGPTSGGTQTQWSVSTTATVQSVYFGQNPATNVAVASNGLLTATTPAGTAGPTDVYVFVQDGGEQIVPEGYSYGPTILEASPDASTSEGGGNGILYGYGFGSTDDSAPIPTGLTISVGGKPATVTGYSGNAYGLLSPPFNLEAVGYTIPPGVAGSSADIVLTTQSGTTTAAGGMHFLPAATQYPLPSGQLAQGIYDPHRNLYYFTDATMIRVFSRAGGQWLTPISVPAAPVGQSHRLWGLALSPDGSKLAVSDVGDAYIYLLDPASPSSAMSFQMPAECSSGYCYSTASSGVLTYPAGVAVSDAGIVYIAAYPYGVSGADGFLKLNTGTGKFTDYGVPAFGNETYHNAISSDNARVFFNNEGEVFSVDTATDAISYELVDPGCCYGDSDLSLSANQTSLTATSYLYDADLNPGSWLTLNDREALYTSYVFGVVLSPDGSLLFQPSVAGIDVFDGRIGTLRTRIALPYLLSENYDALVSDGTDNVLIAITGVTGNGIAVLDFTSLGEPAPLPYANDAEQLPRALSQSSIHASEPLPASSRGNSKVHFGTSLSRVPHVTSHIAPQNQVKQVLPE